MAALNLATKATYETHEDVVVDTQDNEDHTFCGIMFPIKCKDLLPIDHLVVRSVSVRGRLGPLTVWVSNLRHQQSSSKKNSKKKKDNSNEDDDRGGPYTRGHRYRLRSKKKHKRQTQDDEDTAEEHKIPLHRNAWTQLYAGRHKPCPRGSYTELVFDEPIVLKPGEMRALYVHSTLPNDHAIVYDNAYHNGNVKRYDDDKLCVLTGRAHVSPTCFGQEPIWGWGNAWRDNREFVGRLDYGTVYKLWKPTVAPNFGSSFQNGARALSLCQRRWESPFSRLPDEAIYYILNMCPWDWFGDDAGAMKERRKRETSRTKEQQQQQQQTEEAEEQERKLSVTTAATEALTSSFVSRSEDPWEDAKPAACARSCSHQPSASVSSAGADIDATNVAAAAAVAKYGKTTGLSDEEDKELFGDEDDREEEEHVADDTSSNKRNSDKDDNEYDEDYTDEDENFFGSEDDDSEDENHYHRANRRYFSFRDVDSDIEDDNNEQDNEQFKRLMSRHAWFRFLRAQVENYESD